jgi:hypothetical protein
LHGVRGGRQRDADAVFTAADEEIGLHKETPPRKIIVIRSRWHYIPRILGSSKETLMRRTRIFARLLLAFIGSLLLNPNAKSLCRINSSPISPAIRYQEPAGRMDYPTKLMSPAAFPSLPKNVARSLQARRCKIPQIIHPYPGHNWNPGRHNVLRGRFTKPGQYDWAVLCLRNGTSSILVFRRGSTTSVAEIEKQPVALWGYFMNGVGNYARVIYRANRRTILQYHKAYNQPGIDLPLPPINHDGINDRIMEKASTIYYYHRGKWLGLHGAD